tara:strand:- start:332 stop:1207 length:876 start_codon:yes stop_codon:yes gene_type:complete
MKNLNIFCFGFGQVAKNFIRKINIEKIPFQLTITSRDKTKMIKFDGNNFQSLHFDGKNFDNNLKKKLEESNHVLISIPPINGEDIVFENFKDILIKKKFSWITYLSATSVYGNHFGEWVDEKSKTLPTSDNGIARLKAENLWMSLSKRFNLPFQVFRLSGIYSNQFNILKRLKDGEAKIIKKKNHFFSRIHVEDIAEVLFESLKKFPEREIFNISDDRPASSEEVLLYGIELLKVKKPETIEIEDLESEMSKNFYKDSKKVSNKKMKDFFKINLKFPSYIEGLNYINNNSI